MQKQRLEAYIVAADVQDDLGHQVIASIGSDRITCRHSSTCALRFAITAATNLPPCDAPPTIEIELKFNSNCNGGSRCR
ncbi:uncharacterized protein DS421_15g515360 [Arachis hypogaea]|nr:uncharacterized protein DS421_15g515360 [Arachis hypogaea]